MIGKDDITDFYFIRHGPVVKKDGHLPPHDAPLIDQPFDLDALVKTLPHHADWHISPLQRAQQTASLLTGHLAPASKITEPELAEQHFGDWHDQPIATIWQQIDTLPKHNWSFITHDFARHMAKALISKCGVSRHGVICKSASDLPPHRLSWRILAPSEPFWHIFLACQPIRHKPSKYPILAGFIQA